MEPKALYRATVEHVPTASYTLPLSKAEILKSGSDLTIISYGHPLYTCSAAIEKAEKDFGITVELIDLRTVYPWDKETVLESVRKTGRCVVVHESMVNAGIGAEVAASIQADAETFVRLEAPVARVAGWSIHMGLLYERFNIPDVTSKFSFPALVGRIEMLISAQEFMIVLKRRLSIDDISEIWNWRWRWRFVGNGRKNIY